MIFNSIVFVSCFPPIFTATPEKRHIELKLVAKQKSLLILRCGKKNCRIIRNNIYFLNQTNWNFTEEKSAWNSFFLLQSRKSLRRKLKTTFITTIRIFIGECFLGSFTSKQYWPREAKTSPYTRFVTKPHWFHRAHCRVYFVWMRLFLFLHKSISLYYI